MSARQATVLYDVPGPKAIRRYRVYAVVFVLVVLGLLALVLRQMQTTGQFEYAKWEYFVTPKYIEALFVDGVLETVKAAVFAILLALLLGMLFGSGKLAERAWIRWPCWLFVEFFRAVPLLLLIIFIFQGYFAGKSVGGKETIALVMGLALYNGAVIAEIVRAGVQALPTGQAEAGYAIGRGQTLIIVGHVENVFYALPQVIYVETWAEAKRILLDMRGPVFEIRELDALYVPEAIGAMALHHTSEIGSHVELLIGDAMDEPDEWTSLIPGHEGWIRLRDLCDRVIADLETAPETVVL